MNVIIDEKVDDRTKRRLWKNLRARLESRKIADEKNSGDLSKKEKEEKKF